MTTDESRVDGAPATSERTAEIDDARGMRSGPAVSRRRFLALGAGGVASLGLAGLLGYEWPHASSAVPDDAIADSTQVQRFLTRPDLRPPTVRITHHRIAAPSELSAPRDEPRFILVATRHLSAAPSQQGLMIADRQGRLIWFKPISDDSPFDFNAQMDLSTPSITWWQGDVVAGHGVGAAKIGDRAYRTVHTVQAGNGLRADLHEFNLTTSGTALITAYAEKSADLSKVGGSRSGRIYAGHAQEIDLKTGSVLFDWDSSEHIGVEESYLAAPHGRGVYDYFHINSISETPDHNLLISARNTCAVYKVDRGSGRVIWRLNGRRSDFSMGSNSRFYWQHHTRMPDVTTMTVFDDGSWPSKEKQSRAILLDVDESTMHVELTRSYLHPAGFVAANQGSMQLLADGRVFVGWGNQPYFSEFAPDGTLLLDGEFPTGIRSYRAYSHDWVGSPDDAPAIVSRPNPGGGSLVYLSWNGATEVADWRVLAGSRRDVLDAVGTQEWTGFETAIAVNSPGPYFAGIALDANGAELGRSLVTIRS